MQISVSFRLLDLEQSVRLLGRVIGSLEMPINYRYINCEDNFLNPHTGIPCGDAVEYFHRSPASCRRPGGKSGPPYSWAI
jgi:hypothetical protein